MTESKVVEVKQRERQGERASETECKKERQRESEREAKGKIERVRGMAIKITKKKVTALVAATAMLQQHQQRLVNHRRSAI